jgi:hypothetical protein
LLFPEAFAPYITALRNRLSLNKSVLIKLLSNDLSGEATKLKVTSFLIERKFCTMMFL